MAKSEYRKLFMTAFCSILIGLISCNIALPAVKDNILSDNYTILWGDIHIHNHQDPNQPGGQHQLKMTVNEVLDYAKDTAMLDFLSITNHAPGVFYQHPNEWDQELAACSRTDIVYFPAYELSRPKGQKNIYFKDGSDAIDPINLTEDLGDDVNDPLYIWRHLYYDYGYTDQNAITIPHHPAKVVGGSLTAWSLHSKTAERRRFHGLYVPFVELYSERGNSEGTIQGEDAYFNLPTLYRNKGSVKWAMIKHQLVMSFVGGGDHHYGESGYLAHYPIPKAPDYLAGLMAVIAEPSQTDRNGIWQAMIDGHVYASSGPKVNLYFGVTVDDQEGIMGDMLSVPLSSIGTFEISVKLPPSDVQPGINVDPNLGNITLEKLEIIRNGRLWYEDTIFEDEYESEIEFEADGLPIYYYVRVHARQDRGDPHNDGRVVTFDHRVWSSPIVLSQ